MKKLSIWKKIGMVAMAAMLATAFVSCGGVDPDDPDTPANPDAPAGPDTPAGSNTKILYEAASLSLPVDETDASMYRAVINLSDDVKSFVTNDGDKITITYTRPAIVKDWACHFAQIYGADGGDWDRWATAANWASAYPSKDAGEIKIEVEKFDTEKAWDGAILVESGKVNLAQVMIGIQNPNGDGSDLTEPLAITNVKIIVEPAK